VHMRGGRPGGREELRIPVDARNREPTGSELRGEVSRAAAAIEDMLAARDGAQSEAPGQSRQGNWRRYSWTSGIPCVLLQATACLVGRLPTA
jgi:hypothetical protein